LWRRHDAWRRFPSVVFTDVLRLLCSKYCVSWRRRDNWRSTPLSYHQSYGVPRLLLALFAVRSRCRDAQRRICNFVLNVIPRLMYAKYIFFLRRHDDCCRDAWRRFASIVPHGIPILFLVWFGILSHRTLGVGFLASCQIASLG
jgi:hypothetical protein